MGLQFSRKVAPFDPQVLEATAKALTDILSQSEIGHLLAQCQIADVDPAHSKWKRLYNAFAAFQNQYHVGNHVIVFIHNALNPARHLNNPEAFEAARSSLNSILSLNGMTVGEDGKVRSASKANTLSEAVERANRLKSKLERRGVHPDVLKYCATEIKSENFFHAVFEAMKSITSKVRSLSGVDSDGADLVERAFSLGKENAPILAINSLETKTLCGEQTGFINLLKGLYGAVRNPLGHEAKIEWNMSEEDALDIMTAISLVHRKLDKAVRR